MITPGYSLDPINWIKSVILVTASCGVLFSIPTFAERKVLIGSDRVFLYLCLALLIIPILTTATNSDLFGSIWGTQGRASGLLVHISLFFLSFFFYFNSMANTKFSLVNWHIYSFLFICLYMSVQYLGLDPVDWARFEVFATLGNINFSSAFVGMSVPLCAAYALLYFRKRKCIAIAVLIACAWACWMILDSGSLQGLFGLVLALTIFICVRILVRLRFFGAIAPSVISIFTFFAIALISTTQKSWLGGILFQETMVFRRDYWVAALGMIRERPLTGIGFNGYGVNYREYRDMEAAYRTSIDRVSDSAHSVFLDFVAATGLISGLSLFVLILLTTLRCIKILSQPGLGVESGFALVWISFLPQFVVGILNIGTAVWVWAAVGIIWSTHVGNSGNSALQATKRGDSFTTLLGKDEPLEKIKGRNVRASQRKSGHDTNHVGEVAPSTLLMRFIGSMVGFLISIPPFIADYRFNQALLKQNTLAMLEAGTSFGANQQLNERALEFIVTTSGDGGLALRTAEEIIARYPRSDYAWKVIYDLKVTPPYLRERAEKEIRRLDPHLVFP